ncbi:hypothetical protein Tco_0663193 [Tanacetum coccineum]
MGDVNPICTLGDYFRPSHEGYRNTIELLKGSISTWEDLITRFIAQFQQHQRESLSEAWTHFKDLLKKIPHHGIDLWLQYCMENPKQAFVEYASSRTDEAGDLEGLVSNFMASQDTRLSKFEADFKQQQSKMTNKINTVLKAITDCMAQRLPSSDSC